MFLHRSCVFLFLVFSSLVINSQTVDVGGPLQSDRTFYSDTTYIVVQDLIVDSKNELTIEPGTVIKVNYGRSLIVDNGSLYSLGTEEDSIFFLPNHTLPNQTWKWSGIIIKNSDYESPSSIKFSCIKDAETALQIENGVNILVDNSSLTNCQNIGLNIVNSSFCFIVDCRIENNYNGIEISTSQGDLTSNNMIIGSSIINFNHNIYVFVENYGVFENNVISDNIISMGNNGVWIDNGGQSINKGNSINGNFIIKNGGDVGYGLFLALDSTTVSNNIFWNNNVSIFSEEKGNHCNIINNSFYKNRWAIAIGGGSIGNNISDNTFSENELEAAGFKAASDVYFGNNNLMNTSLSFDIVVNNSTDNIQATGNYWGTNDTESIDQLIYDRNDNPDVGYVIYEPYRDSINVRNPISPPYMVKKQIINEVVNVSFLPNPEYDLGNYFMYYGSYENYQFIHRVDIGLDTITIVPGDASIYDELAITAHDTMVNTPSSQINGNESAFAFATIYPYAGKDTIICKLVEQIKISDSNIPYSFSELYWTASGDGFFSDPLILNPIYTPGEEDINNGKVVLSLNVVGDNDTRTDSFLLKIINDPIAFAGNDTVVVADTGVGLTQARAYNYNYVDWITTGDGFFSDDTLVNPVYFPGDNDISSGFVMLIMTVSSECGSTNDSVVISIEPHFSVEGKLWNEHWEGYQGNIIALHIDGQTTRATMMKSTQANGKFRFPKVMKGEYYIYAVPDTNNPENLVPGYYAHKRRWQTAHRIIVDADVYDLDITLSPKDFILPSGEGSISGVLSMPSGSHINKDVYCEPWFDIGNTDLCALGGLSNVTIFLMTQDMSHILDFALTDPMGEFYFKNLPFGSYSLSAEIAGYIPIPSDVIVLSPDDPSRNNVEVIIQDNKIGIDAGSSKKTGDYAEVYPNPAGQNIHIALTLESETISTINLYDRFGNDVSNFVQINIDSKQQPTMNISGLETGLYIGRITSSSGVYKIKFLKR